ncbi:helix-turn-helix domain-containing protein, partial [Streptomyces sp. NPDC096080]|uniref:PucR family transcriptional regulator n=1 Tax=Streptomyces sp. NPDC096080 TaxID=3156693 RepID=UPI003332DF08
LPGPSAVGRLPDGQAFALVPAEPATDLAGTWSLVTACAPDTPVHAGTGTGPGTGSGSGPAPAPAVGTGGVAQARGVEVRGPGPGVGARGLSGALAEARWALASARTTSPGVSAVADSTGLDGLGALLTGIPAEVRAIYSSTVLGPLLRPSSASTAALLETLEVFLAHDGSWARTAEALHLHVNTVHYRVGRIERLTGRDLSRLPDRLDLWAALLCRPDHGSGTTP